MRAEAQDPLGWSQARAPFSGRYGGWAAHPNRTDVRFHLAGEASPQRVNTRPAARQHRPAGCPRTHPPGDDV